MASVDQLQGEAGIKERPDILDDPDTSVMSVTKMKAFLGSTLTETHTHTVERWTMSRFESGLC